MKPTLRTSFGSSYRASYQHAAGTEVDLVEPLDPNRRFWMVELRVPDDTLEGGAWFETLEVEVTQLDFGRELESDMAAADDAIEPAPALATFAVDIETTPRDGTTPGTRSVPRERTQAA